MKKYHVLLTILCTILIIHNAFSCPCSPSPKNEQPFFEQEEETNETDNEEA